MDSPLTDAERNLIVRMFGPGCSIKSSTVARLYVTPPNGIVWKTTNIIGAVAVMNDNNMKGHFIRIIDIKNMKIMFEQEIYENFEYKNPRAWFHTFESDSVVHGFSFAHEPEARGFFDSVHTILMAINGPNYIPLTSQANSTANGSTSGAMSPESKKKKQKKQKPSKKRKDDNHILEISGPTNFKHESHVGWDAQRGFEIRNIPPEWKKLFQQAGIRKSELRDAETASMLMNIVGASFGGFPNTPSSPTPVSPRERGPPPPPPPGLSRSRSEGSAGMTSPTSRAPPLPPSGPSMARLPPPPPMSNGSGIPGNFPPPPPPPPMSPKSREYDAPMGMGGSGGGGGGGGGGGRSDLMSAIRGGGVQLRKVDPASLPDITTLPETDSRSIVDTLAMAIKARRLNIREEEDQDEEEGDGWDDEDDEWSD